MTASTTAMSRQNPMIEDTRPRNLGKALYMVGETFSITCSIAGIALGFAKGETVSLAAAAAGPIILGATAMASSTLPLLTIFGRCACKENYGKGCSIAGIVVTAVVATAPIIIGVANAAGGF